MKCYTDDILTEAGTTTEKNIIDCRSGINPYGLSAGTLRYNILMDSGGLISGVNLGGGVYAVPDGNTAPYANGLVMIFTNTNATTITNVGQVTVVNQMITCLFANANTTISGSGRILLHGRDDWTPPAGAALSLIFYDGYWYETGRSDPT